MRGADFGVTGFFRLLSMDRQELGTSLNLALPDHQLAVEEMLDNVDLLILDNDALPTLSLSDTSAREGDRATFTATLSAPSGKTVLANYSTADGTADALLEAEAGVGGTTEGE